MRNITLIPKNIAYLFWCLAFFAGLEVHAQCPTIIDPTQSFCDINSPTVANLSATNNGGGVVWYANATGGTPLSNATGLVNGEDYYADSAAGCGTRQLVTVTIYSAPLGLNFQGVCVDIASNATISDLQATGNNVQWYSVSTGGSPLSPTTVLNDNTIYYASQTNPDTGCQTSRLSVFVNVGVVPVPTGNPVQQFCLTPGFTPTVANLLASGNNNWYITETSAAPLPPETPLINGQSYFATTVDPPCESIDRFEVAVTLVPQSNSGTSGSRSICISNIPLTAPFNLFGLLGGAPQTIGTWSGPLPTANGHLGTVNVSSLTVAGSPYVFTYAVGTGVCAPASSTVTIYVLPMPTASLSGNANICSGNNATVTFTGTPNATITYTTSPGGTQTVTLNSSGTATVTAAYTATTTITLVSAASATTPSCVQPLTGSVTINVAPLPTATIAANATICSGGTATVTFTGTPNATITYTANPGGTQTILLDASGTATIANTYTTTTTYTLVSVVSAGNPSCTRPVNGSVTITVLPVPVASLSANATVCPGQPATVTFNGTPNATITYTTNPGGTQTITLNGSGSATLTQTYLATTTYTLVSITTAGTPSCTRPVTGSITISVLPAPTASIAASTTVCSGTSATVTFTGTPNATVTYTANPGGTQTIVLNNTGTATLTQNYTATTIYTLISVATAGSPSCATPLNASITITVIPTPVVSISGNASVCPGSLATVTFTGTPNATVTYTANPGGTQTIVLNAAGTATITNTYTANTTYTLLSITTAGTPGCSRPATGSITIAVLPQPTVSIATNASVCPGGSATVTFTGTPNATVTYTSNPGGTQTIVLNASGTASITSTYATTTTFTLISIASAGTPSCSQPAAGSVTITVVPLPTATMSANATVCAGQPATITFNGTPNAVITYTANPGGTQTIALDASGTASVTNNFSVTTVFTLISISSSGTPNCTAPLSGTVTITVIPTPTVSIASSTTVCPGGTATVTFTGTPNATVTYTSNPGGTQTITLNAAGTASVTNTYTTTTIYTLVSIATAGTPGCVQPASGSITISVAPLPVAAIASNATVCPGQSATVTFTGTPNATVTYTANPGGTQTIVLNATGTATLTNTYTVTTVYTLVSVSAPGTPSCSQPASGSVTITVVPVPAVTISADTTVCPGQSATITFSGTPNAIISYSVNPGGSQTIALNAAGTATITNTYTSTTVYNLISATSPGTPGCTQPQTGTVTITVIAPPTVAIASSQSVCPGGSATITFTGTPNSTVTYNASPGGDQTILMGATGTAAITNVYTTTTVYTLLGITTGTPSCSQTVSGSVTITVVPLPTASLTAGTVVCAGSASTVIVNGTPNATVTYTLTPGTGGTVTLNNSGVGGITGNYSTTTVITLTNVSVSGTPPCSQPLNASVTVQVVPPPVAGNNAIFSICESGNPQDLFLLLGAQAQPGGTWSPALASGSGIFNPAVDPSGTYIYTLAGTPPCAGASASVTVTVTPPADAGTSGSANLCSNQNPVDLFAFLGGTPQTGGIWTPTLTSGTGLFDPGLDVAGIYTYTIAGTPPCAGDAATVTVSITPGPDAGISGNAVFCQDSAAQDLFLSLGGTPQAGGTWSPALSSGTGVFDPAVDTPGVYTYTFEGNQPCDDDSATVTVTVNPIPDAGADGTAFFCTNYPAADLFAFLGGSPQPGGTWSPALASGTGVFDPLVDAPGVYIYTVGGGLCATDTASVTVGVGQSPNAGGAGATLQINACTTDTAIDLFTGLNGSQGSGTWNDDDLTGALNNNLFDASMIGAGTYHFTYTVSGGVSPCLTDSATVTVIVSPVPNAGTFVGPQSFCNAAGSLNLFTLITGYQTGGDWLDSNNLVVPNTVDLSGLATGTYSFTYQITTPCGTDTESVQFTIAPAPGMTSANVSVATPVCIAGDATVILTGLADGNYLFTYNLSGSNTAPDQVVAVVITGGTGSFVLNASDIPNVGLTTLTFVNIANAVTNCVTVLTDVTAGFTMTAQANIDAANLSIAGICLGSAATVTISGATGLPDGTYQFNYTIPTGTPATGSVTGVIVAGGSGSFVVPAPVFASAGNYTLTITGIVTASGCDNLSEDASASFAVIPLPDATGAIVSAGSQCYGFDVTVQINGAGALANGAYQVNYTLGGANIGTGTASVTFANGSTAFDIPSALLQNPGTTTLTLSQLLSDVTSCGTPGTAFNVVSFDIIRIATPDLQPQGERFCVDDQPTIADLTANINGTQPVLWYDAPTGGNLLSEGDVLVNGTTYYASYGTPDTCESFERLEVTVDLSQCPEQDDILIPDGFSPNNDGVNDAFTIRNLRALYPNFKLEIYNRYGNLLYTGNNFVPDWNGTATEGGVKMGGNQVPVGVYFYILEFNDGIRKAVQGRVYLSR